MHSTWFTFQITLPRDFFRSKIHVWRDRLTEKERQWKKWNCHHIFVDHAYILYFCYSCLINISFISFYNNCTAVIVLTSNNSVRNNWFVTFSSSKTKLVIFHPHRADFSSYDDWFYSQRGFLPWMSIWSQVHSRPLLKLLYMIHL